MGYLGKPNLQTADFRINFLQLRVCLKKRLKECRKSRAHVTGSLLISLDVIWTDKPTFSIAVHAKCEAMCYFFKNKMPLKMEDCDLPTRPIRTNFFEIQGHEVVARHLYCKGKFKVLSQHANLPKLKLTWPSSWMRREALTIVKYSRHPRADAR
jgi:hypothetical protein